MDQNGYTYTVCKSCKKEFKKETIPRVYVTSTKDTVKYTGKKQTPEYKVTDAKGRAIDPKYYKVTYSNNIKPGDASVAIWFKGRYEGVYRATFTIAKEQNIPPKVTGITYKGDRKKITITWNPMVGKVKGYQIVWSTDKRFITDVKSNRLYNAKQKKYVICYLKSKTKYYVKMRSYRVIEDDYVYSAWSEVRSIVTK